MQPLQLIATILVSTALVVWLQAWPKSSPHPIMPVYKAIHTQHGTPSNNVEFTYHAACLSPVRLKLIRSKNAPVLLYLAMVLLGASGDIELNPGSADTIYPCGICSEPVTWEQNAICCDGCQTWHHKQCLGMSSSLFDHHLAHADAAWICPNLECDKPNFSSILFNAPVIESTDNRFSVLEESMRSTSTTPSSPFSPSLSHASSPSTPGSPQATSSPQTGSKPRKRNTIKNNFKVAVMNFNSIRNKTVEFQTFLEDTDPDIVIGTESWLTPDIGDAEVFPTEYSVFRKDRPPGNKKSGGGVFILARKEYICSEIKLNTECELIFVELKLKDQQNVKIGAFYRPPWVDEQYMEDYAQVLNQVNLQGKGNIWIAGDYNLPLVNWEYMSSLPGNAYTKSSNITIDSANDHGLSQVVTIPTRKENILDLFFTSNPSLVNRVTTVPPLTATADHDIVFIDLNTQACIPKQVRPKRYIFRKANWEGMREELDNYSVPEGDTQQQWDHFESNLKQLIDKHIPSKPARPQKHKPWINREVITMIHRRNRAYKKWKKHRTEENHQKVLKLRSKCQAATRKAHSDYTDNIFNLESPEDTDKTTATKRFWGYVKAKKKDSCNVAPLKSNGTLVPDAVGKAEILNNQYCSVFTDEDPTSIPSKGPSNIPSLPDIVVTEGGVHKLLQGLKPDKAAGPDKISPRILKELADVISRPLTIIFQHSIDTGSVPSQWREAFVTPIFKKGDRHTASNYRPVSLTAVCCKLCEHIIAKAIINHLEEKGLLSDYQHGFRGKRSCETQLLLFIDDLARSMCEGNQVDVAVLDFSKAFDVVPHKRLLHKLDFYGIRGQSHQWIRSFLQNRSQRVVVDGEQSTSAPVTSGVPQGSVLGPILFLVFINDMPECVKSRARLFADDSIVYRNINSKDDCTALQDDLDALHKWEMEWGMHFNPSKCNIITVTRKKSPINCTYSLKGVPLEKVEETTYLGMNVTKDLSWHSQISRATAKGNRALGFTKRNIASSSKVTKERAYTTLVRPTVEYASTIWSPHQKNLTQQIEKVQRRAARYVTGNFNPRASVSAMLTQLEWETLEQRRLKARVTMCYKIIHSIVAIPSIQFVPTVVTTRGNQLKFVQIQSRTNYYKYTFFPAVIPLWNQLPQDVASAEDLELFKRRLANVLLHVNRY